MLETQLRDLLRRALSAGLAAPLALTAACGGSVTASPLLRDAGGGDTGDHAPSDAGCGIAVCNTKCFTGYVHEEVCVDGVASCVCVPESPPPFDAGVADVVVTVDAGGPDVLETFDAGDPCHPTAVGCGGTTIPASCFDPPLAGDAGTYYGASECVTLCGGSSDIVSCEVVAGSDGNDLSCFVGCLGRRPVGMRDTRARGPRVGRHFADAAQLEAAAVDAFAILEAELRAHRAPERLLRAASAARRDEVRHARMTARLARRYGARAEKAECARPELRSIEALALENAVEGCVRETVGALLAMHQAETAADPHVRAVMASIAPDETRHAALGWAVAEWAEAQLTEEARGRIRAAQDAAVAALRSELSREVPSELRTVAGLPRPEQALAMLDALNAAFWSGRPACASV